VFASRGYGVAELNLNEVAIDNKDRARTAGIYKLFDDKIDCGALMAWAWGMHRVIDAIETDVRIDPKKIVVTGHSRYGKACLLAGAFDDRIALTVPSHSGTAGASPYRFIYAKNEQLHNIVGAFPYWFRPDFNQFVNKVERLPFDQHELLALVAPRALLATEGTQDIWINPQGSQLTYLAAKQVYDFLGAPDRISIRFRPVGHIPSNEDLLDFADHVFFGKPLPQEFGKLAYPQDPNGFTWTAPK
jgi:endo-1,4-beta-xylanase